MISWLRKIFKIQAPVSWGQRKTLLNVPHLKVVLFWVDSNKQTETFSSQEFANKTWLFIKGNGDYQNGAMKKKILPGTNAVIVSGAKHSVMAGGERVEVLEIQYGQPVVQEALQLTAPQSPPPTAPISENK